MSEHGMITIDRKYYLTKMICQNRIFRSTALASIFGATLHQPASRDLVMMRADFIKYIEMSLRK
jgi:hypothetical protein